MLSSGSEKAGALMNSQQLWLPSEDLYASVQISHNFLKKKNTFFTEANFVFLKKGTYHVALTSQKFAMQSDWS